MARPSLDPPSRTAESYPRPAFMGNDSGGGREGARGGQCRHHLPRGDTKHPVLVRVERLTVSGRSNARSISAKVGRSKEGEKVTID